MSREGLTYIAESARVVEAFAAVAEQGKVGEPL